VGRDGEGYSFDLGFGKTELFLQMGLDSQDTDQPGDLPDRQSPQHPLAAKSALAIASWAARYLRTSKSTPTWLSKCDTSKP
jgi:hypothetical protein